MINLELESGGLLTLEEGGSLLMQSEYVGSGGDSPFGGSAIVMVIRTLTPTSGVKAGGIARVPAAYAIYGLGGVVVGRPSQVTVIKPYDKYKTGICRLIVTSIPKDCFVAPEKPKLNPYPTMTQPVLSEYRFRVEKTGKWCDIDDAKAKIDLLDKKMIVNHRSCTDGVVPKIVRGRQPENLPPRNGVTTNVSSRGIARKT